MKTALCAAIIGGAVPSREKRLASDGDGDDDDTIFNKGGCHHRGGSLVIQDW